jgi:multicomponent Na+:H+ antiporter subunit E
MTRRFGQLLSSTLFFAFVWLLLTDASASNWGVALLVVLGASFTSIFLWSRPLPKVRWLRVPVLAGYFFWNSARAGFDVARRVFLPSMPLDPALLEYETRLQSDLGRALFAWMISLMPGTASLVWSGPQRLTVHVIDQSRYRDDELRRLEVHLLELFPPQPGEAGNQAPR